MMNCLLSLALLLLLLLC